MGNDLPVKSFAESRGSVDRGNCLDVGSCLPQNLGLILCFVRLSFACLQLSSALRIFERFLDNMSDGIPIQPVPSLRRTIITMIAFLGASWLAVALRVFTRWFLIHSFGSDDVMMLVALVSNWMIIQVLC
jgi:hypothetical protein